MTGGTRKFLWGGYPSLVRTFRSNPVVGLAIFWPLVRPQVAGTTCSQNSPQAAIEQTCEDAERPLPGSSANSQSRPRADQRERPLLRLAPYARRRGIRTQLGGTKQVAFNRTLQLLE